MNVTTELLLGSPYQGYAYAYPHKTAYRRLAAPVPLVEAWAHEPRQSLFLYMHVPFCEMRCGFCNLFTQPRPRGDLADRYLDALEREAEAARPALRGARFARLAIGGGTPTYLTESQLSRLLALVRHLGADPARIPASVETSPATATPERLGLLKSAGVTRVSIGVQSFREIETTAAARPQRATEVENALAAIRAANFATMNVDLIYGLPEQTVPTWLDSVCRALEFAPEELYLYPLYVRPLTGLGKSRRAWDDLRLECYRRARALLRTRGYEQISMRMFRSRAAPAEGGPRYCCQEDGMVGLGCGARSYTRGLHWSREYAVGAAGVRAILANYLERTAIDLAHADYGIRLDGAEQRRRHVLQSLLQCSGLDSADYHQRFGSHVSDDVPQLGALIAAELAETCNGRLRLTERGLERSDAIGPWLYSPAVRTRMESFELT